MPTVQRYGPLRVATNRLPGARKTAAQTDVSTGAGLHAAEAAAARRVGQAEEEKLGAIGRFGATVANVGGALFAEEMDVRREERKRADQVKALEWRNALDTWQNENLYGPAGALTKKGKDAQGLPETVGGAFDAYAGDLAKTLGNEEQRLAFAKDAQAYRLQLDGTLYRHVYQQQQTYEASELEAHTANRLQAVVATSGDPRSVGIQIDAGVRALEASLPRLGAGPEGVQQQVRAFRSQALEGAIMQQLAEGHAKAAASYFEEAQGLETFDEKAITRITNALKVGEVRGEAQQATAKILVEGGTLSEQRAKAKTINDPEVQDAVLQRLEHEAAVKEAAERDQHQQLVTEAYAAVDAMHNVDRLPPATIAALGSSLPALREYAAKRARGEPLTTDWTVYAAHLKLAGDDPAAFAKADIAGLRGALEDTEYKELLRLQLAVKGGDRKTTDAILEGPFTVNQIIDTTLTQYGLNPHAKPGTPEAKAVAELQRMLSRRVAAAQQPDPKTGKPVKVTDTEIQATLDELLGQTESVPGSWWNFWPGGKAVRDTQRRLIDTTIGDIPAGDRQAIEYKLRLRGLPITDATILDTYIESKIK